jgi:chaperonin cofactor prefoldin
MGYRYAILILGDRQETTNELFYETYNGSYSATDNHWFYEHKDEYMGIDYKLDMYDHQTLFELESLEIELESLKSSRKRDKIHLALAKFGDVLTEFGHQDQASNVEYKDVTQAWHALQQQWEKWQLVRHKVDYEVNASEHAYQELKRIVLEAKKWEQEGYTNVRVVYGLSD